MDPIETATDDFPIALPKPRLIVIPTAALMEKRPRRQKRSSSPPKVYGTRKSNRLCPTIAQVKSKEADSEETSVFVGVKQDSHNLLKCREDPTPAETPKKKPVKGDPSHNEDDQSNSTS